MSIDKIKQRIKMIEENDFNIINEAISGSENDIRPLFKPKDTLIGKIKTKLGFNDRNHNILNPIGTMDQNSRDVQAKVDRVLRSGTRVNIGDNTYLEIPTKDVSIIKKIYSGIDAKNIKINDLDNNYDPKIGYSVNGNVLKLERTGLVEIYYDDINLTNLKSMVIFNKNNVFNNRDFINAFNELNSNKIGYNIYRVGLNNNEIKIMF